ncbi:MAG: hypothetical protein IJM33_08360, partial [Bacteroidales bacterium]|nr:hypothetical protein [Bacteroidales bacterium]
CRDSLPEGGQAGRMYVLFPFSNNLYCLIENAKVRLFFGLSYLFLLCEHFFVLLQPQKVNISSR